MSLSLPTTKNIWSLNLFNQTLTLETPRNGDVDTVKNLTVEDAKHLVPEDSEYIDWFWERYA
jgi:hypothetical protein